MDGFIAPVAAVLLAVVALFIFLWAPIYKGREKPAFAEGFMPCKSCADGYHSRRAVTASSLLSQIERSA